MPLTIRRTGSSDYGQYVKALVCGFPGNGKTVLGATSPKPLIADCEGGLMSVADRRVPFAHIENTSDLLQLRAALDQEPDIRKEMVGFVPDTVVIDTIDEVQKMFERERLKETGRDALNMQDFGWLKDRMLDVIRGFRNLPLNVLFLCHLKEVVDEESGAVSAKPGLKGAVADEIAAYMDVVGVISVEEFLDLDGDEAVKRNRRVLQVQPDRRHDWLKDRSWKLPPKMELLGKDDFTRICGLIFASSVPDSDDNGADIIETAVPEVEKKVEQIERLPEQPKNPIKGDSDNSDNSDNSDKEKAS